MVRKILVATVGFVLYSVLDALSWNTGKDDSIQVRESVLRQKLLHPISPSSVSAGTSSSVTDIAFITTANISLLYYLTFSSKLDDMTVPSTGFTSTTSLSNVLLSDDSPFQEVDFPWTFLFNGRWVSNAFVGPNGALHFSKDQPCYPYNTFSVQGSPGCNFDTSYYDLIAGFLTDLDPVDCAGANLTYAESSDSWTVLFTQFCYYASTLNNTFSISVFDDDHIKTNYYQVSTSGSLPTDYLTGIRPPSDNTYLAFVAGDKTISTSVWDTTITGYYPESTSYVRSEYAYTMCPVSLFWCMQNRTLSLADFQSTTTSPTISLSTIKLSCLDDIEYGLAYSTNSIVNTSEIISCTANQTSMTISCAVDNNMKTFIVSKFEGSSTSTTVLLWLAWRSLNSTDIGSSGNWTVIPAQSLPLTVTSSVTFTSTPVCNYDINDCTTENLYNGNYTCLDRSCYTGSKASLFSSVDCNDTCTNSDTVTASSATFVTDPNGDCCTVSVLDCAGYCSGDNIDASQVDSNSEICCAFEIDCFGDCGGDATTNQCGVCLPSGVSSASCYAVPSVSELTAATIGTLFYASFSSTFNTSSVTDTGGSTPATLVDLLQTDDSPFYQLELSSSVLFSGRLVSTVFVNPNGAVHYSKEQPCYPANVFIGGFGACDFNNAYYDLLAVFLTDLNPYTASDANITFSSSDTAQTLYFENFPYFGTNITNSFMIRWYASDDRIEMIYVNITKTNDFPVDGQWISGIRPAESNPLVVFDSNDVTTSSSVWSTDITGAYPSALSDVATGMKFTLCPQSVFWCITPSILDQSALSQTEDVQLNLTTIMLSCVEELSYSLIYSDSATYRNNSNSLTCQNASSTSMSLTCLLPRSVIKSYQSPSSNVTLYFWVAWMDVGSSQNSLRVLPMQPLELLLSPNITLSSTDLYSCNNEISGCAAASMATGNFSCLNQSCYDGSLRSIFRTETCADTCSAVDTTIAEQYMTGANNDSCCLIDDLDCAGYCNGNNTVAYYSSTDLTLFCCASTSTVDCAGVCNGDSVINICGTCTSTDIYGSACYNVTQLVIDTGETDGNLYPTFDFSQQAGLISKNRITLRNTGAADFIVLVTNFPDDTIAPELSYADNVTVPAFGEREYWVNSSLVELYNGSMTYWVVKTLTFTFTRTDYASVEYSKALTVRPRSSGCAGIFRDTCIRLPGCMFCLDQENPIILRTEPASKILEAERRRNLASDTAVTVDEKGEQDWMRRLFVAFTPPIQQNSGRRLQGICKDGWLQNNCD